MIILDASVLIAHLESSDSHHDRATDILLENCDDEFASSTVTLAGLFGSAGTMAPFSHFAFSLAAKDCSSALLPKSGEKVSVPLE